MCDSGTDLAKIKVFKVFLPEVGGDHKCWITEHADAIADAELTDSEVGDVIRIEVAEMTRHQIDTMPDFEGW